MKTKATTFPLWEALKKEHRKKKIRFHVPAHLTMNEAILPRKKFDFTELAELDNLANPTGIIKESQKQAAHFFEAGATYYLVNGSSSGIMAALWAVCRPGDTLLMGRNMHRSAVAGLIACGAVPLFVPVESAGKGMPLNISASQCKQLAGKAEKKKALLVTSPSYYGITADLKALCNLTKENGLTLIVDEAHGGHFIYDRGFPMPAARAGADIWVNSAHKTMGAFTPGAFLHHRTDSHKIDEGRLRFALSMFQTSSPPYPVMASLELVQRGTEHWRDTIDVALFARKCLTDEGFALLGSDGLPPEYSLDLLRLTVLCQDFCHSGIVAGQMLRDRYGIEVEIAGSRYLLLMVHPGHSREDIVALVNALKLIRQECRTSGRTDILPALPPEYPIPPMLMSPRAAAEAKWREILLQEAKNCVAAGTVSPFPPGTPLIIPGELITAEAIEQIMAEHQAGTEFVGLGGEKKPTIQIVDE